MTETERENYGPIMIRNGFLRDSEGSWDRLSIYDQLVVKKIDMGPSKGRWGLFLSVYHNDLTMSFMNYPTREEAQQALDHLFSGGVIRFQDNVPILAQE